MKVKLVYPKWPKLPHQPEFHLPPHGPVVFAATLPPFVEIEFVDENVEPLHFSGDAELVFLSVMLTCQVPRAIEIADAFRQTGRTVICGGIATHLHAQEMQAHADSVFLGEAEGRMEGLIQDYRAGTLRPLYDYGGQFPDMARIGPARRDILNRRHYEFRGVQMVDLFHASRGCRFNCFPCCTPYLGGRQFRPRPIDQAIAEMEGIRNNRLFIVDNSLAQDDEWEKALFREMIPLKKKWVSHPIKDDPEILDLAVEAGAWYVYQAIIDTSDYIRRRVRHYKERGIGVEGTIILGTDEHDEDSIRRLVDFLLEIELDLAEFTILTPFPHSRIYTDLEAQGRILHKDWRRYTAGECVFQPRHMSPARLEEMYEYAWETFYANCSKEIQMAKLYLQVMKREKQDGTFQRYDLTRKGKWGQ